MKLITVTKVCLDKKKEVSCEKNTSGFYICLPQGLFLLLSTSAKYGIGGVPKLLHTTVSLLLKS